MFKDSPAFNGFSVNDLEVAKEFYGTTLGLDVHDGPANMGLLTLNLATGGTVIIYLKTDHQPATYTVLNFPVDDIEKAVAELKNRGVTLERYEGMMQDENGIARGKAQDMGPDIAWFKDPAGNILSVLQT